MKICISALTNVGLERDNNEDACIYCPDLANPSWPEKDMRSYLPLSNAGALIVVADGMGGPNAGEVASALAIGTIQKAFTKEEVEKAADTEAGCEQLLTDTLTKAHEAINARIIEDAATAGMGTTIVICWLQPEKAHVAWLGDSRCYLYRKGEMSQVTKDHSYVQELVDDGKITQEEAFSHPDNNIITRGLGDFDAEVVPDIVHLNLKADDTLLLCSDGLCGYCTDEQIAKGMGPTDATTGQQVEQLMKMALDAGGPDNISIAVAHIINDDDQPPTKHSSGFMESIKKLFGC